MVNRVDIYPVAIDIQLCESSIRFAFCGMKLIEALESGYSSGVVQGVTRAWTRNLLCVQFVLFRPKIGRLTIQLRDPCLSSLWKVTAQRTTGTAFERRLYGTMICNVR